MIRRKKLTVFTDAKDTTSVLELKKMIEGNFCVNLWMQIVDLEIFRHFESLSIGSTII